MGKLNKFIRNGSVTELWNNNIITKIVENFQPNFLSNFYPSCCYLLRVNHKILNIDLIIKLRRNFKHKLKIARVQISFRMNLSFDESFNLLGQLDVAPYPYEC
ncbi:hypothetical protein ACKWTF_004104 [Chironomus riparius]